MLYKDLVFNVGDSGTYSLTDATGANNKWTRNWGDQHEVFQLIPGPLLLHWQQRSPRHGVSNVDADLCVGPVVLAQRPDSAANELKFADGTLLPARGHTSFSILFAVIE